MPQRDSSGTDADRAQSPRARRLTIRARLTLTYAGLVTGSGAVLIALVYLYMSRFQVAVPGEAPGDGAVDGADGDVYLRITLMSEFLNTMLGISLGALVLLALASSAVGWVVAGRMLAPLSTMNEAAKRAASGDLSQRLALKGPRDEIRDLADTYDHMLDSLETSLGTYRRFAANASHELRTPLTVIHGFLETLAEHPNLPPEQQQQFIRLMQHDCARMRHLVDDLMTLTTLEDPQQQNAPKAACNLSRMAEQIVQDTRHLSAGRHTVAADIAPDIWVAGRESELYQALSNLAFNAVRHNPEPCAVHITLRQVDNPNPYKMPLAEFSVRDEGKGIAAEHLPYLTDRFYRVDAGRSRENGGTGLGLAIAKHALANHQASLHIESSLHHGSEFTAQIPTIAPDLP